MILWTRIRLTFWSLEEAEMKEGRDEMLTTMVVSTVAMDTTKDMATTKEEMIFPTTTMPMAGTETATPTVGGILHRMEATTMLTAAAGTATTTASAATLTITRNSTFTRKQTNTKQTKTFPS
jgi:hypothetical protein